jgi:DNA polymerase III delta prime subunit
MLDIHPSIETTLKMFCVHKKIPNIIFHGPSGCGKSTIVCNFINKIYNENKNEINNYVMYVNCSYGKGIKFIRDELKFFAKTNIHSNGGTVFKTIILFNADKLTIDAQSALRRCIELFTHTTRFFIVIENQYKLMRPILSRFCSIYIPHPQYKNNSINLYKYNIEQNFSLKDVHRSKKNKLKKIILSEFNNTSEVSLLNNIHISNVLYEDGFSSIDLINLIESCQSGDTISPICKMSKQDCVEITFVLRKIKKEIRQEKLLMFFILNCMFMGLKECLKNIPIM